MKFKNNVRQNLKHIMNAFLPIATCSLVSGVLIGGVVTLYGLIANWLVNSSKGIYIFVQQNLVYLPLFIIGLVAIALIMTAFLKATPTCKGGGVPRTEGVLRGLLTFRWLRTLITTIFATFLTYFGSLSLGSEGPSIQLGASLSAGVNKFTKLSPDNQRVTMTGGAAAGLAVAFNAPLTGIIFAVEEVHKKFNPQLLIASAITILTGNFIFNVIMTAVNLPVTFFDFGVVASLPLKYAWTMLLVGVVIGIIATMFNYILFKANKLSAKLVKMPLSIKLIIAFVISGLVGLLYVDTIGGGHNLIMKIGNMSYSSVMLLILFILKFFLIIMCFSSGAIGGLFIPMLTLGAIIGGLLAKLFILLGVEEKFYTAIVLISMTAFFGASVRAPITAFVLVVEVTQQFNGFLMSCIAIVIAYLMPMLFKIKPLYDKLLEDIIETECPSEPPMLGEGISDSLTANLAATLELNGLLHNGQSNAADNESMNKIELKTRNKM